MENRHTQPLLYCWCLRADFLAAHRQSKAYELSASSNCSYGSSGQPSFFFRLDVAEGTLSTFSYPS